MWNELTSVKRHKSEKDESIVVSIFLAESDDDSISLQISKEKATVKAGGKVKTDIEESLTLNGLEADQLVAIKSLLDDWLDSHSKSAFTETFTDIDGEFETEEPANSRGRLSSTHHRNPQESTQSFNAFNITVGKSSVAFQFEADDEYEGLKIPSAEEFNLGLPSDFRNVVTLNAILFDFFDKRYSGDTGALDIDQPVEVETGTVERIEKIFDRFSEITLQLRDRQRDREPLRMDDEYDVQYLLNALLRLHFDDVRDEEYLRRHANKNPRIDFLLEDEKVGIEVKRPSVNHPPDKIRTGLAEDKEQYRSDARCNTLLCFIYDPDKQITNPAEFEKAVTESTKNLTTRVTITQ